MIPADVLQTLPYPQTGAPKPQQPALFELKHDRRPEAERTAAGR